MAHLPSPNQTEERRRPAPTIGVVVEVAELLARYGYDVRGPRMLDLHAALNDVIAMDSER